MADFCKPVQLYMHAPVHTIRADDSLTAALERMHDLVVSSLPVVDDSGRLCGVISRSDLLRAGRRAAGFPGPKSGGHAIEITGRVADIMTREVLTAAPSQTIERVCQTMVETGVHRIFVTSGDDLVGVFSTRDVMRVVSDARFGQTIEAFMSSPVFTVSVADNLTSATALLEKAHITGVIVTENDWPVGLFSQSEALAARDMDPETSIEEVMDPSIVCMPASTKMFRAARQAITMNVRRVVASRDRDMIGIVSGLDFARAAALGS